MQMKCPRCGSEGFILRRREVLIKQCQPAKVYRHDRHDWEEDLDEVTMDACGDCDGCNGEEGICENLSMFDAQVNRQLMNDPIEQTNLSVDWDSDNAEDYDDEGYGDLILVECTECMYQITDSRILGLIDVNNM